MCIRDRDRAALDNGANIVYLEDDEFIDVSCEDALVLKEARVPRTIYEAEVLINCLLYTSRCV